MFKPKDLLMSTIKRVILDMALEAVKRDAEYGKDFKRTFYRRDYGECLKVTIERTSKETNNE